MIERTAAEHMLRGTLLRPVMPRAPRSPRTIRARLRRRWLIVRENWRDIWRGTTELLWLESPRRRVVMQTLWALGVPLALYDIIAGNPGPLLGSFMLATLLMTAMLVAAALLASGALGTPGDEPPREDILIDVATTVLTIPLMFFCLWSAMRMLWPIMNFIGMDNLGAAFFGLFANLVSLALVPTRLHLRHDALGVFGGLLFASPLLAAALYFGGADRLVTISLVSTMAISLALHRGAVVRLGLNLHVRLLAALARVSPRALDLIPARAVRKYGCSALVSALVSASRGEPRRMAQFVDDFSQQLPMHVVRTLQVRAIRGALRADAYSAIGSRSLPLLGLRDRSEPFWLSTLVAAGQLHAEVLGRRAGATRALLVEELESILEDCYITLNRELQSPQPCPSGVEAFALLGEWIGTVQALGGER